MTLKTANTTNPAPGVYMHSRQMQKEWILVDRDAIALELARIPARTTGAGCIINDLNAGVIFMRAAFANPVSDTPGHSAIHSLSCHEFMNCEDLP